MGNVDAVVEDGRLAEDKVLGADAVVLFGILAAVEPSEVADTGAVAEVGHYALFAGTHLERLEA